MANQARKGVEILAEIYISQGRHYEVTGQNEIDETIGGGLFTKPQISDIMGTTSAPLLHRMRHLALLLQNLHHQGR